MEDYERQCSTALALRTRGRGALRLKSSHFFGTGARFAGGGTYHTPGPSTKTNARIFKNLLIYGGSRVAANRRGVLGPGTTEKDEKKHQEQIYEVRAKQEKEKEDFEKRKYESKTLERIPSGHLRTRLGRRSKYPPRAYLRPRWSIYTRIELVKPFVVITIIIGIR